MNIITPTNKDLYTTHLLDLKEKLSPELWLVFIDADNNFTSQNIESISKKIKELQDSNQKKLYSILVFPYPKSFASNNILKVFSGDFVIFHPYVSFPRGFPFQCSFIPLGIFSGGKNFYFDYLNFFSTQSPDTEIVSKLALIFGEKGLPLSPTSVISSYL